VGLSPAQLHTDKALSTFISGYTNGQFYADILAPVIETDTPSDKYQQFSRADIATIRDDRLGLSAEANELHYTISTGTYKTEDRGLVGYVSNKEQSSADDPHNPLEKKAMMVMNSLMLGRERRVASMIMTAANYAAANTFAAATLWSNESTGTPLANIQDAVARIAPSSYANSKTVAVCALEVWNALRKHPDFQAGASESAVITPEQFLTLCQIDELYVSNAQYNTANPTAAPVFTRVYDATKFAVYRVPTGEPTDEVGLFCATFRHVLDGEQPISVRRWEEPKRGRGGSQAVQVELSDDEVVVQNDMGTLITTVL
jgi:hypothetical protein